MANELLSIVVLVFNVSDYVDQCISSILNQTYQNLEVIIVVGNSSDNSNEICEKFARLDNRVKIHVQNEPGMPAARKEGTELASGKYIIYVDGDDYIDADMCERLMASRDDFDLVVARWRREEELQSIEAGDALEPGAYRTEEEIDFLLDHMVDISFAGGGGHIKSGIAAFVWNKLHRTELAQEVFADCKELVRYVEDCDFTYRYLLKCKAVLLTDICGYHYRITSTSGVHTSTGREDYLENLGKFYNGLKPVLSNHPKSDRLLPQLQRKVARILNRAPSKMGFVPTAQNKVLVFPYLNLLNDKRIVLCGAGFVGQSYWNQIRQYKMCQISLWVDREWSYYRREGRDVSPMDTLPSCEYDYAVIAVFHSETADLFRHDLRDLGVDGQKILWKPPFVF